jgi:hypothetical protein
MSGHPRPDRAAKAATRNLYCTVIGTLTVV